MENNEIKKMSEIMDEIEVGANLVVHNGKKKSTIGGYVKKKILKHDPETHEEFYHIELDVDGNIITLNPHEDYYIIRLVPNESGKDSTIHTIEEEQKEPMLESDELEDKVEQMIERYGLNTEESFYNCFCRMANHWDARTEDEREAMAMALERFICYTDLHTMLTNAHNLTAYVYHLLMENENYRIALERNKN